MNQHKLIVDPKIFEWDYLSNPQEPPEKRIDYMLMTQLSKMCRDKGAVRHDDRADCLALGVKWFTDALALSADQAQAIRQQQEWEAMTKAFIDTPHLATDALALGHSFKDIKPSDKPVYDWTSSR